MTCWPLWRKVTTIMHDRDVAGLYIAEMLALLPVIQRHLNTLGADAPAAQREVAVRELHRLAGAMADLSSGFHVDDCAVICEALAETFAAGPLPRETPPETVLAAAADALVYLQARIGDMAETRRILAANESERAVVGRLTHQLRTSSGQRLPVVHNAEHGRAASSPMGIPAAASLPEATSDPADTVLDARAPDVTMQAWETRGRKEMDDALLDDGEGHEASAAHESSPLLHAVQMSDGLAGETDSMVRASEENDGSGDGNGVSPGDHLLTSGQLNASHVHTLDEVVGDLETEPLTAEELALVESFRTIQLRQAPPTTPLVEPIESAHSMSGVDGTAQAGAQGRVQPPLRGVDPDTVGHAGYSSADSPRIPSAEELDTIPPEMKRLFVVETEDDLQELRVWLLKYEQHPDDPAILPAMGRIAHKIKGAAATLGYDVLAELTHIIEEVIKVLQTRRVPAGPVPVSVFVGIMELLQVAQDAANAEQAVDPHLVTQARALYDELVASGNSAQAAAPVPRMRGLGMAEATEPVETPSRGHRTGESETLLRVDVRHLDNLMKQTRELVITRAAMKQARDEVERLQAELDRSLVRLTALSDQLSDLRPAERPRLPPTGEVATSASAARAPFGLRLFERSERAPRAGESKPPVPASAAQVTWDELELDRFTEVDHAFRSLNEVAGDISTTSKALRAMLSRLTEQSKEQMDLARQMQHEVNQMRLVPLKELVPRLQLEVRRIASHMDRAVEFVVRGEATEIDRNISEALAEPLIQLVRNAVVHGIESREERLELGKAEVAAIWMHAYYVGGEVIIEVGDDGRGVNPHRLLASAVAAEVLDSETAHGLSTAEALDLMFVPGVTTAGEVRAVGGRGIGLDEVRTAIQRLKGTIVVRSEPGQGAVFRIRVPISHSFVRSLRVQAGGQWYAVPFSAVVRTMSLDSSELLTTTETTQEGADAGVRVSRRIRIGHGDSALPVEGGPAIGDHAYEEIPAYALAELLGFEQTMRNPQMALVVDLGHHRAALLVDGVFGDEEVVVQALPPHLRRRAVHGAIVTLDGQVMLLLDIPELVAGARNGVPRATAPRPRPTPRIEESKAPRILVVDDSVSIRRALELTLTRAGFEVLLAHDGIEALDSMLVSLPQVVVLDIEMPRLDGFELLAILREWPQFAGVRVVMLTSRAGDKHREHALKLGAEAYLIKPCPQETLIETVRGLLVGAAVTP